MLTPIQGPQASNITSHNSKGTLHPDGYGINSQYMDSLKWITYNQSLPEINRKFRELCEAGRIALVPENSSNYMNEFERMRNNANVYWIQGQYEEAMNVYRKLLNSLSSNQLYEQGSARSGLGSLLSCLNRPLEASKELEAAIKLFQDFYRNKENEVIIITRRALVEVCRKLGDKDDNPDWRYYLRRAEVHLRKMLIYYRKEYEKTHSNTLKTRQRLGSVQLELGMYKKAEKQYIQVLTALVDDPTYGYDNPVTDRALQNLQILYRRWGDTYKESDYSKALELYEKVLSSEATYHVLRNSQTTKLIAIREMGYLYIKHGKYILASGCLSSIIRFMKSFNACNNSKTAKMLLALGRAIAMEKPKEISNEYIHLYATCEKALKQVFNVLKKDVDPHHIETARTCALLAHVLFTGTEYRPLYKTYEQVVDKDLPYTSNDLKKARTGARSASGPLEGTEYITIMPYIEKVYDAYKSYWYEDSSSNDRLIRLDRLISCDKLMRFIGHLCLRMWEKAKKNNSYLQHAYLQYAGKYLKASMEIQSILYSDTDPSHDKIVKSMKKWLLVQIELNAHKKTEIALKMVCLAKMLVNKKKYRNALFFVRRALKILEETQKNKETVEIGCTKTLLGYVLIKLGDGEQDQNKAKKHYKKAKKYLIKVLDIYRIHASEKRRVIAGAMINIGIVLKRLGDDGLADTYFSAAEEYSHEANNLSLVPASEFPEAMHDMQELSVTDECKETKDEIDNAAETYEAFTFQPLSHHYPSNLNGN